MAYFFGPPCIVGENNLHGVKSQSIVIAAYSLLKVYLIRLHVVNIGRLTSLALKSLHAALVSQWMQTLYIPVEILNKMALWLSEQQNEDGAFVETSAHHYDRSFLVNQCSSCCAVRFFLGLILLRCIYIILWQTMFISAVLSHFTIFLFSTLPSCFRQSKLLFVFLFVQPLLMATVFILCTTNRRISL